MPCGLERGGPPGGSCGAGLLPLSWARGGGRLTRRSARAHPRPQPVCTSHRGKQRPSEHARGPVAVGTGRRGVGRAPVATPTPFPAGAKPPPPLRGLREGVLPTTRAGRTHGVLLSGQEKRRAGALKLRREVPERSARGRQTPRGLEF